MKRHARLTRRAHLLALATAVVLGVACRTGLRDEPGHGHGHAQGGEEPGHAHEGGEESQSFTLFTDAHGLFVELAPALTAGRTSTLAAHVTELSSHRPVTSGRLTVTLRSAGRSVASATAASPARRGIFTPALTAPGQTGEYDLRFAYADAAGSPRATWDAGPVRIEAAPPKGAGGEPGEIRFLIETQWSIPFRVERAQRRRVARVLTVPATVSADPRLTHGLSAGASGRVEWAVAGGGVTVVGSTVRRGDPLGRLIPGAAAEHWSTLRQDSEVARIERQRAAAEHERVARLARDGLVPGRRQQESQASLAKAEAALRAARQREGGLSGGAAAVLTLRAPSDGTVVALHATHGQKVAAGELIAEVASADEVLVRATVFQLDLPQLERVHWAQVRRVGIERPIPLREAAAALLTRQLVVDPRTLSAPLVFRHQQGASGPLRIGDLVEMRLGVGELEEALTLPSGAVVEIGTQPYLMIMVTGESFTRRRVRLGPSDGERVAILEGLAGTERVVTVGGLDVYLSSVAGSLESHMHQ